MDKDTYLTDRVNEQITWFDNASMKNQRAFNRCRVIEMVSAAAIPFITGMWGDTTIGKVIVGGLGVLIGICAGLISLKKYQENWVSYRAQCEALKHEKYVFLSRCDDCKEEEAFCQFVKKVEGILSQENTQWQARNRNTGKEKR
ncbi:DUF4231 domain-containing protein [Pseudoalteromonas aurantia]|uniref:DUF4231 domain-containing protein n=1 Tax=Pseudoalteromonas aurantia TaxID=43654 RepID=A0A5S3VBV8_9GAMM|nr:DUF4231 domain-containing protein [Pseudoalteromonas aurantia]TMO61611.1 hypothetical protein CWC18_11480 [Pseudoalteromonas aurantia]TMO69038.1 hypothetical protein CWC19_06845 [Pseudoalteromonas aurantia]TMO78638.1 hypothetical protein CWC20_01215 [Pseudoalteromonas aurantia]